jgi:glyoxylase I family protein
MAITGMVHFNVNCSDYDRSRAFYAVLGFQEVWRVPERNTPEVAAAVGMPPYLVKGDLLEWKEPRDESPPYPHLYHYGIARVALATDDLEGDMARLAAAGAVFLSKPVSMPPSSGSHARFVCFKDPDGTILELVENSGR